MLFILGEVVLLRRQFHPYQYLQIVVNMIFSSFIDVSMTLLGSFTPTHFASQILSLLTGCAILALGICVEVVPNVLLVVPGEGIVKAIAQVSRKKFGSVKIIFDVTLILTAACLSLLFFRHLNGLGIGTIISALLVGRIVNFIQKHLHILKRIPTAA